MFETKVELGPQRLFSPIQSILPFSGHFNDFESGWERSELLISDPELIND